MISGIFLLDQKIDSEELKERLIKLIGIFRGLTEEELSLFKGWFKWIVKPRISEELHPKIDEVLEKSKVLEVENMVYNLANTIEEMKKKAEVTGIEKGIEKGKIEVAKSALEKGADIDFVIKITGLDEWVVKKLKEEV